MIPFDVEYVKPTTAQEAVEAYRDATANGQTARYLSGGTELVTSARDGKISFDVVIDLKQIPETTALDDARRYGACLRLSEVTDQSKIALLRQASGGVADRTARNSITLGGNVCGMLPYREALLPFLLFNGTATIAGENGQRTVSLADIFDKRIRLGAGELLLALGLGDGVEGARTFYRRRTRDPRVDYPLVTLCMARLSDEYRLAVGGTFGYPVRNKDVERIITQGMGNKAAASAAGRAALADEAASAFPDTYWSDLRGSAEYRKALLTQSIEEGLEELGEKS